MAETTKPTYDDTIENELISGDYRRRCDVRATGAVGKILEGLFEQNPHIVLDWLLTLPFERYPKDYRLPVDQVNLDVITVDNEVELVPVSDLAQRTKRTGYWFRSTAKPKIIYGNPPSELLEHQDDEKNPSYTVSSDMTAEDIIARLNKGE